MKKMNISNQWKNVNDQNRKLISIIYAQGIQLTKVRDKISGSVAISERALSL